MTESTLEQIAFALDKAGKPAFYQMKSLGLNLRLNHPISAVTLPLRKTLLEGEVEDITAYTFDTMEKAVTICVGVTIEQARELLLKDGYESGGLGIKCLQMCGCSFAYQVAKSYHDLMPKDKLSSRRKSVASTDKSKPSESEKEVFI